MPRRKVGGFEFLLPGRGERYEAGDIDLFIVAFMDG